MKGFGSSQPAHHAQADKASIQMHVQANAKRLHLKTLNSFLDDVDNVHIKNICRQNQSVGNAGVAFVKGANERIEFFEKINKT